MTTQPSIGVPVKRNSSDVQDAEACNFRRPVTPRHQNFGVHTHWLFLYQLKYKLGPSNRDDYFQTWVSGLDALEPRFLVRVLQL